MEMDLKGIIDKIKKEGVSEAEKKAGEIISSAEEKARGMIETAKKERENIVGNAEEEAGKLQANAEKAIKQASRDTILSLKEEIVKIFDIVLKEKISDELKPDVLREAIIQIVNKFGDEEKIDLEVLLNEKDKKELEKTLFSKFKEKTKKELILKVSPAIENGFRIGEKGKNSYYDITDEAVAEAFKTFLNPRITRIIGRND